MFKKSAKKLGSLQSPYENAVAMTWLFSSTRFSETSGGKLLRDTTRLGLLAPTSRHVPPIWVYAITTATYRSTRPAGFSERHQAKGRYKASQPKLDLPPHDAAQRNIGQKG